MLSTPHRHTVHPVDYPSEAARGPGECGQVCWGIQALGQRPMAGNAPSPIPVGSDAVIQRWPAQDGLDYRLIPWGL